MEDLNPEQSHKEEILLRKIINIGSAAVLTELAQSNSLFGQISFGLSIPRFVSDYDSAVLRNLAFQRSQQWRHFRRFATLLREER